MHSILEFFLYSLCLKVWVDMNENSWIFLCLCQSRVRIGDPSGAAQEKSGQLPCAVFSYVLYIMNSGGFKQLAGFPYSRSLHCPGNYMHNRYFSGKLMFSGKVCPKGCLEKGTNKGNFYQSSIHQYQDKRITLFNLDGKASFVQLLGFCFVERKLKLNCEQRASDVMCFLSTHFWAPISVVLCVTGQAMEQEVNPALDITDSQMKCLIAKVHRSRAVEPEVSSVVKSLQFVSCICLSLPWCLVCVALTWHLSVSLWQQTISPVKVYNCICLLIFLFRLSQLWVFCGLILSPLLWRGQGAGWILSASLEQIICCAHYTALSESVVSKLEHGNSCQGSDWSNGGIMCEWGISHTWPGPLCSMYCLCESEKGGRKL